MSNSKAAQRGPYRRKANMEVAQMRKQHLSIPSRKNVSRYIEPSDVVAALLGRSDEEEATNSGSEGCADIGNVLEHEQTGGTGMSDPETRLTQTTSSKICNSSDHAGHEVRAETIVEDNGAHANQSLMTQMLEIRKQLLENQKKSMETIEELKTELASKKQRRHKENMYASPITMNLVRKGYKYFTASENLAPWDIEQHPLGNKNIGLTEKIQEYVRGTNPETCIEEINGHVTPCLLQHGPQTVIHHVVMHVSLTESTKLQQKNYWRNVRRQKETPIWDQRKLDARRRKNRESKIQRRIAAIKFADLEASEKSKINAVFLTLPVEVTQSTKESGEEEDPFCPGAKVHVKVIRRRRWESQQFRDAKKKCDIAHMNNLGVRRSRLPRKTGSYSTSQRPHVLPEFIWIIEDASRL